MEQNKPSIFGDSSAVKYTRIATGDGPLTPSGANIPGTDKQYLMWAIVEQVPGAGGNFVLRMYRTTGTPTTIAGVSLNPDTGGAADVGGIVTSARGSKKLADVGPNGGIVWMVWVTAPLAIGESYGFYPYPCSGLVVGHSIVVHHFECVADAFYPASPIRATTAQASCGADNATITDLRKIAFNATEGTLLVDFILPRVAAGSGVDSGNGVLTLTDSALNNYFAIAAGAGKLLAYRKIGGVQSATMVTANAVTAGARAKAAFSWGAGQPDTLCLNGGAVVSMAAAGSPAAATELRVGRFEGNPGWLNGWICTLGSIPRRYSSAELQAATA
ncbi:hypothetical protein [Cupriavidus basilensis]|uniref:hypothetical protein n=1 Tax=Cupriavidus basilensis TaxID=68895 RepID=UPI0028509B80|nr:hypothetical protein [Cupriavidus basilensis]MDR3382321.1 hypothetical protein [Cupriavidus basilensis]